MDYNHAFHMGAVYASELCRWREYDSEYKRHGFARPKFRGMYSALRHYVAEQKLDPIPLVDRRSFFGGWRAGMVNYQIERLHRLDLNANEMLALAGDLKELVDDYQESS